MDNFNISIFENRVFWEIINEIKLFSKFKIKYHDELDQCIKEASKHDKLMVIFIDQSMKDFSYIKKINNFPTIIISEPSTLKKINQNNLIEKMSIPFKILDFQKKIVGLMAKSEFKRNSIITLKDYVIDRNERKIKKGNLELQLSEKETNFLILFSKNKVPISKKLVLKSVWKYSAESETHTVETHIHRLRKKILEKFGDKQFIKNDNKGYYI